MKTIGPDIAVWLSVDVNTRLTWTSPCLFTSSAHDTLVNIHRYYTLFISHSDFPILKKESLESVISLTGTTFATSRLNSSVFMLKEIM